MEGWMVITLAVLAWAVYYAGSCWWFPFKHCWCCKGRGVHLRKDGKVYRECKWVCKGRGRKLRIGRKVYNHVHGVKAKSK